MGGRGRTRRKAGAAGGSQRATGRSGRAQKRANFLALCRYLRSLYPSEVRIAIVMNNFSPHLSTKKDQRVGDWAKANNVELAYVPTNASFLSRIECHFTSLRYFALKRAGGSQRVAGRRAGLWAPIAQGGKVVELC